MEGRALSVPRGRLIMCVRCFRFLFAAIGADAAVSGRRDGLTAQQAADPVARNFTRIARVRRCATLCDVVRLPRIRSKALPQAPDLLYE